MTLFDSSTLEIEFSAGVWTSVTTYYRAPVSIRYGRPTPLSDVGAGVLTVRLDNPDGRFTPENSGSPYYPNVVPEKRIRWKLTKGATTWTRHVGWIQAWQPVFPGPSLAEAYVDITSTDALGRLEQRELRSKWTELALWQARTSAVQVDAWEAAGLAGYLAAWTNYSPDSARGIPSNGFNAVFPELTFTEAREVSCGPVMQVNASADGVSCKTSIGIQAGSLNVQWLVRCPEDLLDGAFAWFIGTLYNSSSTALANLSIVTVGGVPKLRIYAGDAVTFLAGDTGPLPQGGWVGIQIIQNAGTAANSDFNCCTDLSSSGGVSSLANVAVDLRNVTRIELPGGAGKFAPSSIGGVIALGTRTALSFSDATTANTSQTLSTRWTSLQRAVSQLGLTFTTTGLTSQPAANGRWSGRSALAVAQELWRGARGIVFARPRDSVVVGAGFDALSPLTPAITIDCEGDLLGQLRPISATDDAPTRVDVETPSGTVTVTDVAAEAGGLVRPGPVVQALCSDTGDITALGQQRLTRGAGLQIPQVTLDLARPLTDWTSTLFDESSTLGGLYPTQRVRLGGLPTSHWPSGQYDAYVQGWTERYDDESATITLDLARAPVVLATETWTGSNGAAWPGQWATSPGAGSLAIQGNRGRISPPINTSNSSYARLTAASAPWPRVDFAIAVILNNAASKGRILYRYDSGVSNGYYVQVDTSGTITVARQGGIANTLATVTFSVTAGTSYTVRVVNDGSWHGMKIWATSGSEPADWMTKATDSGITSSGYFGLQAIQDGSGTSRTVDFDDLTIREGQL